MKTPILLFYLLLGSLITQGQTLAELRLENWKLDLASAHLLKQLQEAPSDPAQYKREKENELRREHQVLTIRIRREYEAVTAKIRKEKENTLKQSSSSATNGNVAGAVFNQVTQGRTLNLEQSLAESDYELNLSQAKRVLEKQLAELESQYESLIMDSHQPHFDAINAFLAYTPPALDLPAPTTAPQQKTVFVYFMVASGERLLFSEPRQVIRYGDGNWASIMPIETEFKKAFPIHIDRRIQTGFLTESSTATHLYGKVKNRNVLRLGAFPNEAAALRHQIQLRQQAQDSSIPTELVLLYDQIKESELIAFVANPASIWGIHKGEGKPPVPKGDNNPSKRVTEEPK